MKASQPNSSTYSSVSPVPPDTALWKNQNTTPTAKLVSGPMPAMRSSAPALSASCSSLATPPSSQRLMPSHADALAPGDQGVADLVGEQRDEEHERADDAGHPVGAVALARDGDREPVLGERERVEQGDERDGDAHADRMPAMRPSGMSRPTRAGYRPRRRARPRRVVTAPRRRRRWPACGGGCRMAEDAVMPGRIPALGWR